jgi:eukaryotic-like serine/threonine-protein kinase
MQLTGGTRLGPYEIVHALGAGGMGEVWRANDTRLGREVAIKVLPHGLAANEQFLQRFEREARTISSLNHPHVCTLYDVGEVSPPESSLADGPRSSLRYLVMELIEGESLADRLKKGPLPIQDVLRYGRQIASALDAAHRKGVIHRDLKPGNVMLTRSGTKLLDFGLAKSANEGSGVVDGVTNLRTEAKPLTQEGTILGTFQYMAPEQLEGLDADPRTDIFALGAVLYEMATGRRAFQAASKTSLIAAIVSSHPEPISNITPMTPPALEHVVRRCLEKNPDDRWQSAHDIAGELQWISEAGSQAGVVVPPSRRRKRREHLAWGLLTASLVALAALALALLPALTSDRTGGSTPVTFTIPAPEGSVFRSTGERAAPAAVSPDGRRIVFGLLEPSGQNRLWLRELHSADARPLPGTEDGSRPFWSPDGRSIGFFARGKLMRLDLDGGVAFPLADARGDRGGTWTPGGEVVFAPESGSPLFAISAAGGTPRAITELDRSSGEDSHRYPSVLADGKTIVFLVLQASGRLSTGTEADQSIQAVRLDTGERKLLLRGAANAQGLGNELLYYQGGSLRAQTIDLKRLELTGGGRTIIADVKYDSAYEHACFSSSGRTLVYEAGPYRGETVFTWIGADGARLGTLGEPSLQSSPSISPDGRRVAFLRLGGEFPGIWVTELESGRSRRVSSEHTIYTRPQWSSDGRLAYTALVDGNLVTLIASLSEGRTTRLLDDGKSRWSASDWSRDGRTLLLLGNISNDLFALDLDGSSEPVPLLAAEGSSMWMATFSPNGRWIAFSSNRSGIDEVEVISFPPGAGRWVVSNGGGVEPKWSDDGSALYYRTPGSGIYRIEVDSSSDTFRIGHSELLFQSPPILDYSDPSYDVAPGGRRFLISTIAEKEAKIPMTISIGWRETR